MVQEGDSFRLELEGKQKGRGKIEGKKRTRRKSSRTGVITVNAMTLSVAEKATTSSAGNNRACSNGRSGENKCGDVERAGTKNGGSSKKGPLYYESELWKELLYLQRFWAYRLPL